MLILKMNKSNAISSHTKMVKRLYTREELKEMYHFSCRIGCYNIARIYLYALYGMKECFFEYGRSGTITLGKGRILAFEYPPIKA